MKDLAKITLNLAFVFIFSGAVLALVYAGTEPRIETIKKVEKQKALKSLVPEASFINSAGSYEPLEGKTAHYYVAKGKDGKPIGYIATSYSKGYSSIIKMMVAADTNMRLKGIKILDESETPGLGDDVKQKYFQDRFKGKTLDQLVVVTNPDPTKIQAITGATISSKAATRGVRAGLKMLIKTYMPGNGAVSGTGTTAGGKK
ncbi:MAG: RnfABCDGE type electron transport complex subunit G [Nitrospiraceae bacterium]|nr:RnfABCDGE type electron transport complex subunit G [Nitrospiraceae bacterium]